MHCTLFVTDLMLATPGGARFRPPRIPATEQIFARGDRAVAQAIDTVEWYCRQFGVARQQDWPVAPFRLAADAGTPGTDYWLCCDPVHLRADRTQLVLANSVTDLAEDEARALIAALNTHFATDGISLLAPTPQRWYLRSRSTPRIVTTGLNRALHRSVNAHLPQGPDALQWHRLINEAQMILHAHPVNETREAQGKTPVNSVWPWGGGTAATPGAARYEALYANDALTRALAAGARVSAQELPVNAAAWLALPHIKNTGELLVLDELTHALGCGNLAAWQDALMRLECEWMTPLLDALRTGNITTLSLVACNATSAITASLTRAQRWRWWRRARPLDDPVNSA